MPRELSEVYKYSHVKICQHLLNCYNDVGKSFLERIVTDET